MAGSPRSPQRSLTSGDRARLVAYNAGVVVVAVALVLPWAEVAGERRHGFGLANLLLRVPEIRSIGDHLRIVGTLWYAIPAAALAAWAAQFTRWPPRPGALARVASAVLLAAAVAMSGWLAVRGVGFPQPGPLVAVAGAVLTAGAAVLPGRGAGGGRHGDPPGRRSAGG